MVGGEHEGSKGYGIYPEASEMDLARGYLSGAPEEMGKAWSPHDLYAESKRPVSVPGFDGSRERDLSSNGRKRRGGIFFSNSGRESGEDD
ncbi:MAG TPA: hypothetical protein IAB26_04145 [Candidatus Limivivens merdigallinarum]|uniref:Uncharacterized protein n=1 Tax=Candidatus Limivivens merdigallinarum TaxID=2840859 RepID=A0A9D1D1H1_9FIRM|nr:hypothetical protein [Candidatus Limivivens merdigallinarum]